MNNKTVDMGGGWRFRMWVSPTGWLFVQSKKSRGSYSIAKVENGEVVHIESEPAIRGFTNEELARAWEVA